MACENTAEATRGGLASGMTAVELDISMSQDKVTSDSFDLIAILLHREKSDVCRQLIHLQS